MTYRLLFACALSCAWLPSFGAAAAESAAMLQASAASAAVRYELGAVIDVRQSSVDGVSILATTPGGAADRMGLQQGDRVRSINGRPLHGTAKPATVLEEALQEDAGEVKLQVMRDGKLLSLSGQADKAYGATASCGYVTSRAGVPPRSQNIFRAEITQVDGKSTPLQPSNRHEVKTGKHVLVVREFIDQNRLNSSQLLQIAKMKRFELARAYKSIVVDIQPDTSYRIGARLLKDKLDTQSIRDNAYWEPVVWEQIAEPCR